MTHPPSCGTDLRRPAAQVLLYHTEQAYARWITRCIFFHGVRHPRELGAREVEAFLTHLAVARHVAASTQNQALCALLFRDREVLRIELDPTLRAARATKPKRLTTVLTQEQVCSPFDG